MKIIITLIIIGILVELAIFAYRNKQRKQIFTPQKLKQIQKHWQNINQNLDNAPQQAILDADKLLNQILELHGYQGTVGEKLQQAKHHFKNNNEIWQAHKMRNKVAHEFIKISKQEAKITLKKFKNAIRDLKVTL